MFKTEKDVTDWLYSFHVTRGNRNLAHLNTFLATVDNPHLKLKTIHVAGTNGKGSTVSYIRSALMASGYRVATFTSPFITCFGERMSIQNEAMKVDDLIHYATQVKNALPCDTSPFTSFDLLTLISFLYFEAKGVDIAIYETGIGGRLDGTNVIMPLAALITNVGHDHAEILGETQALRAMEKLGIVKVGIPLFTTEEDPELIEQFKVDCRSKNTACHLALEGTNLVKITDAGTTFDKNGVSYTIGMYGNHQYKNAALALSALAHIKTVDKTFSKLDLGGIALARWQGRFEIMTKNPTVVLDGAHNKEGIEALLETTKTVYPNRRHIFVFAAIATKDAKEMVEQLSRSSDKLVFTKGLHPQGIAPEELSKYALGSTYYNDYEHAITKEIGALTPEDVLVFCGSLYFISDVRQVLLKKGGN